MLSWQDMSDRLELQQLVIDYANAIDAREFDRLDAVFTSDAELDYRPFGGIAGRYPEVKVWLQEVLQPLPPFVHLVGNMDFRIHGDQATGRVLCLNPMPLPPQDNIAQCMFYGLWYVDSYVRTAAGWRIQTRTEDTAFKLPFPVVN